MDIVGENTFNYVYRPQAAAMGQSTVSFNEHHNKSLKAYTNPATASQLLNVQINASEPVMTVQLFELTEKKFLKLL